MFLIVTFIFLIGAGYLFWRRRNATAPVIHGNPKMYPPLPSKAYDVIIVGAGPSGSTAAYYMAKAGLKVVMLEKATFPRDKFCGEAWCTPALDILEDMGVLKGLEARGVVHDTDTGGFISPSGVGFIDRSGNRDTTSRRSVRTCSIRRMICDEAIARNAEAAGAKLEEGCWVTDASFNPTTGTWSVSCEQGESFVGRVLLICDGSNSFLGKKLGFVKSNPTGFCTRQYWRAGTHQVSADGVLYYPKYFLPGYMALFKHANGDCYLGAYLLPGGTLSEADLLAVHQHAQATDEFITKELGPNAEECDGIRIAPIRIRPEKSYYEHCLIVGDAAGQVDPMTGEGIHTAMIAARFAAGVVVEMFAKNNFSAEAGKKYEWLWWREFGFDSKCSEWMAVAVARFPWVLDAMAEVARVKGKHFMIDFGEIMTGVKPKVHFLHPRLSIPLGLSVVREAFRVYVLGKKRDYCKNPYVPKKQKQ
eukprot:PhF_6_TR9450/c0_g1_i1/m.14768